MSHTIKLWERIIEYILRKETHISENQFSFMPRRITTEAIYLVRNLIKNTEVERERLTYGFH